MEHGMNHINQSQIWALIANGDTRPTKFTLGCGALSWAIGLALPGDTLVRPVYHYMAEFASEAVWMVLWLMAAIGYFTSTFVSAIPVWCRLISNLLGMTLYTATVLCIFASRTYPFPASIGPDMVIALAALWLFTRSSKPQ